MTVPKLAGTSFFRVNGTIYLTSSGHCAKRGIPRSVFGAIISGLNTGQQ